MQACAVTHCAQNSVPSMDFQGQKLAERLMLYIICIAGLVAFCMGWLEGSFATMMKVRRESLACHGSHTCSDRLTYVPSSSGRPSPRLFVCYYTAAWSGFVLRKF